MRPGLAGRCLGVTAACGVIALWAVFLYRNPYAGPADPGVALFGSLMMLAAALSAVAAALGAHLAMYLLFFVSFFPVGFWVLLGPGLFKAIGWLNLTYLVSAVVVHRAVRTAKRKGPGEARP